MHDPGQSSHGLALDADHLRNLFQYSTDLISVIDADGILRYASPSHERELGYSPDELIGKRMLDFVHSQDLPKIGDALSRLLQEPEARTTATFRFRHKDGSWRWLESSGRNLVDNPQVAGFVANSRDVTQRVQAEEELHRLHQELELRVQERTVQLNHANELLRTEIDQRERAQQETERGHRRESVLNALLRISMQNLPLHQQLEHALDQLLSISWLPVLPQGAIFLVGEDPEVLELQVSRGLNPATQMACARVDFGRCLCGQAALSTRVQYTGHGDERHEIELADLQPHGHYCIPIRAGGRILGTILLYLSVQHARDAEEEEFLSAVAHTLAGTIQRKQVEEALRDSERQYRLLAENATDMISRHSPEGIYLYASPVCHSMLGYHPEELVGHDAYEFFHPDDVQAIRQSHSTILEMPTIYTVNYRMRRKDGTYLWVETSSKTIHDQESGLVEEVIAITRDISERKQAEDTLQQSEQRLRELYQQLEEHSRSLEDRVTARTHEIQQRREIAESLRGMLTVLNSELAPEEVLDHIVLEARRLLGSDTSAIYRLQEPCGSFVARTVHGLSSGDIAEFVFPPSLTLALRDGAPVSIPDVTQVPASPAWLSDPECRAECCRALLAVPLIIKGEVYGSLVLFYSSPRIISEEEVHLAVAFADQAALAIENARLHEQVREAAVLGERARLARELHDSVTQALFSMTLLAEAGQRLLGDGDLERVKAYLGRLGEMSQQSLKEMRLLVYELRPLPLESVGLVGALQQRLDAVESRAGVEARLLIDGTIGVPVVMEEDLYRIAEQALNNALKHGSATAVTVRIHSGEERMAIEVVDNGCGFDPEAVQDKGGQGLMSMRERAHQIGGVLTLASAPGQGTTIKVEVEIPGNARTRSDG